MKTLKRTWADVSMDDLEHNYNAIMGHVPSGCRFLGVILNKVIMTKGGYYNSYYKKYGKKYDKYGYGYGYGPSDASTKK